MGKIIVFKSYSTMWCEWVVVLEIEITHSIYFNFVKAEETNKRHAIANDSGKCKIKKKTAGSNKDTALANARRKKKLVETAAKQWLVV